MGWREGLAAGFDSASGLLGSSIAQDQKLDYENKIADRKMADTERLAKMQDEMQARAEERREQIRRSGAQADIDMKTNPENVAKTANAQTTIDNAVMPNKQRLEREGARSATLDAAAPDMLDATSKLTKAKQGIHGDAMEFDLNTKKQVLDLRQQMAKLQEAGDNDGAAKIEKQILSLTGGTKDVPESAKLMAHNLSAMAKDEMDPAKKAELYQKSNDILSGKGPSTAYPIPSPANIALVAKDPSSANIAAFDKRYGKGAWEASKPADKPVGAKLGLLDSSSVDIGLGMPSAPTESPQPPKQGMYAKMGEDAKQNRAGLDQYAMERQKALEQKQADVSANFDAKIAALSGLSKRDALPLMAWFDENNDVLSFEQRNKVRDIRNKLGLSRR